MKEYKMKNKYLILGIFLISFLILSSIVSAASYVSKKIDINGNKEIVKREKCINGDYILLNLGNHLGIAVCRNGRWIIHPTTVDITKELI